MFYRLENEHASQLVSDAIFQAEHSLGGQPRHHHQQMGESMPGTPANPSLRNVMAIAQVLAQLSTILLRFPGLTFGPAASKGLPKFGMPEL